MRIDRPPDPAHYLAQEGDAVPDEPAPGYPAPVASDTEPREPRTRHEHAKEIAPPGGPQGPTRENEDQPEGEAPRPGKGNSPAEPEDSDDREERPAAEEPPSATKVEDETSPVEDDSSGGPPDPQPTQNPDKTQDQVSPSDDGPKASSFATPDEKVAQPTPDDTPCGDRARPVTGKDRTEHIADVLARLHKADADGLAADDLHTIDPDREIWASERTVLHHSLINDVYGQSAEVPCEHKAIIAGGLSGAGKTTVLANHPEIDPSQYLTISPDNMKEEMARRGMIPAVEGLSPMEASELAHEESSYLARQLALRAQADGKNIIWDITMSDQAKTEQRILELRDAGYDKIDGLFVHIPIETSLRRTEARYWADQEKWLAGVGLGGRLIPPDVILRQMDPEWDSRNRQSFESVKTKVDNWEIRDNSVDDSPAVLVESSKSAEDRRQP